jgi:hypothetical protein
MAYFLMYVCGSLSVAAMHLLARASMHVLCTRKLATTAKKQEVASAPRQQGSIRHGHRPHDGVQVVAWIRDKRWMDVHA